jgi:CMP-N-acetylneuraminic acid synthetase
MAHADTDSKTVENMKPKILAIIPARGGSKGLPRKNIRLLAGKPLIAYTIEVALKSKYVDKVIVSTEDEEITEVSKKYGAEVIERPNELAKDDTLTTDVIFHVLEILKVKNYNPDIVVLLQPTSPLRKAEDIDNAIELFLSSDCESVVSVCEIEHPPYWSFKIEEVYLKPLFDKRYLRMRRQDLERTYIPNGAIYVSIPRTLYKYKGFYCNYIIPYIMPIERSVDIDNEIDFMLAELLVKKYGLE